MRINKSISTKMKPQWEVKDGEAGAFPSTHWSLVMAAGEVDSTLAADALSRLCMSYWYPVYAYVRRDGHNAHDSQDLTQEFFMRLIERRFVAGAMQERGRFRSFLLTALKRFLINEWHRNQAQKRGAGHVLISLEAGIEEERYLLEPVDKMTADRIYERRWALAVLDSVMEKLCKEQTSVGNAELFEFLKAFLYGGKGSASHAEIGVRFGLTECAVKSKTHRLRQRYRELLYEEVAQTVACQMDVEDELRQLLNALRT